MNARGGQLFMNAVGRQMAVDRGVGPGGTRSVALAEACDVACDGAAPRFGAWFSAIGGTGNVLGDANAAGLTYTFGGTAFGIDYRLDPRFLVGIAGGYVSGTQWVNGFSGNGNADIFNVALYGSFNQGGFYADAWRATPMRSNRLQRVINMAGLPTGIANGSASANQFLGQIETGLQDRPRLPGQDLGQPFGTPADRSVQPGGLHRVRHEPVQPHRRSQTTTSVRSTLGVDFAAGFDLGGGTPLNSACGWAGCTNTPTPAGR